MFQQKLMLKRVMTVLFVGLILSSAAISGLGGDRYSPVGDADAQCVAGCLTGGATGIGIAVGHAAGRYLVDYLSGDDPSDVYLEADDTETHISTSAHMDTIAVDLNTLNVVMENQVNDGSRSVAWSKGKAAAIRAMNNGSTEAEAKAAAEAAVEEYYASMQTNFINSYSESAERLIYLDQTYANTSLSGSLVSATNDGAGSTYVHSVNELETVNVTLTNGEEMVAKMPAGPGGSNGYAYSYFPDQYEDEAMVSGDYADGGKFLNNNPTVQGNYQENVTPSVGTAQGYRVDNVAYPSHRGYLVMLDIVQANDQMTTNINTWVGNTYPSYTAGDIDESDLVDPVTLSQEFATDYEDTGYYAYAAADLALQGTNGTFNESFVLTLHSGSAGRTSDETLEGALFTDWAPESTNGTFVTGNRYNASNSSSLVYFATNDGLRIVEGEFTIESMTNVRTGESTDSTELQEYNRQTADAGWSEEQRQQLLDIQEQLNEIQAQAVGGGGGDGTSSGNFLDSIPGIDAIAAALGISAGLAFLVVLAGLFLAIRIYVP